MGPFAWNRQRTSPVAARGGGVKGAVPAEPRLGRGAPDPAAGAGVERVDVAVVGADEEAVAEERRAALHLVAGLEAPDDAAGARVEGVDLPAPVADVHAPVRDEGRALGGPDLRDPARLAVPDLEGDDLAVEARARLVARAAVHEARVDRARVDGRGGGGAAVRLEDPCAPAVPCAEREERAGVVREVEAAG